MNIFIIQDICLLITSYLEFTERVIINTFVRNNCLRKYDFNNVDFRYKHIDNIFTLYDENTLQAYNTYLYDLSKSFIKELTYEYNNLWKYDDETFLDNFYNIKFNRDRELNLLFQDSFIKVYTRKIAEYIEMNDLSMDYYKYSLFELEEKIGLYIHNIIIKYYSECFKNKKIHSFCYKCGSFGHFNTSIECIFYDMENVNKIINETVYNTISDIIDSINWQNLSQWENLHENEIIYDEIL